MQYADDMVLYCKTNEEAEGILAAISKERVGRSKVKAERGEDQNRALQGLPKKGEA